MVKRLASVIDPDENQKGHHPAPDDGPASSFPFGSTSSTRALGRKHTGAEHDDPHARGAEGGALKANTGPQSDRIEPHKAPIEPPAGVSCQIDNPYKIISA